MIGTFYEIDAIEDVQIRAESIAWLLDGISAVARSNSSVHLDRMIEDVSSELENIFVRLLDGSADHKRAAQGVLEALAKRYVYKACEFASMLNTESRRDAAFKVIVRVICKKRDQASVIRESLEVISKIETQLEKDDAIDDVIESMYRRDVDKIDFDSNCRLLVLKAQQIEDAVTRCTAISKSLAFSSKASGDEWVQIRRELLAKLGDSWESINLGWLRVRTGFQIAESLAATQADLSSEYLSKTEDLRKRLGGLADRNAAIAYESCVKLAIRAFSGLIPKRIYYQHDIELLAVLIDAVQGQGQRAILWSEVAIRAAVNGNSDLCSDLVNERVRHLLESISTLDKEYRQFVIIRTAPALYASRGATMLALLQDLDHAHQDAAYSAIVDYLLRNRYPYDPEDYTPGTGYSTTYSTLMQICDVMPLMDSDSLIYGTIERVVDSLISKENQGRITLNQKEEIYRKLQEIVKTKFPNPRHIRHKGYAVIGRAQLSRFRTDGDLGGLADAAENIHNTADRALVLFITGLALSKTGAAKSYDLMKRGRALAAEIPSDWDRIERLIGFAQHAKTVSPQISRSVLEDANNFFVRLGRERHRSSLRKIIDLAHRIEPAFARSLIDKLDNEKVQKYARRQIELLELKQKLVDEKPAHEELRIAPTTEYERLGSMLLGALQSERLNPIRAEAVRPCIELAARQPLVRSYYVLAWIIENSIEKHGQGDRAAYYLRPIFEAAIAGAELAGELANKSFQMSLNARDGSRFYDESKKAGVEVYDREQAIRYVRSWLEQNAKQDLLICDPTFGPDELTLLQLVRAVSPTCRVQVITGRPKSTTPESLPWDEVFLARWADLSEQSPPSTRINMVGTVLTGECPIQTSCLVSGEEGLDLGSSFRDTGVNTSPIFRNMSAAEVDGVRQTVDAITNPQANNWQGKRLRLLSFSLC